MAKERERDERSRTETDERRRSIARAVLARGTGVAKQVGKAAVGWALRRAQGIAERAVLGGREPSNEPPQHEPRVRDVPARTAKRVVRTGERVVERAVDRVATAAEKKSVTVPRAARPGASRTPAKRAPSKDASSKKDAGSKDAGAKRAEPKRAKKRAAPKSAEPKRAASKAKSKRAAPKRGATTTREERGAHSTRKSSHTRAKASSSGAASKPSRTTATTKTKKGEAARRPTARSGASVDQLVASFGGWQAQVAAMLRRAVEHAAPQATATVRNGQLVYSNGHPFAFLEKRGNRLELGFWRGDQLVDAHHLLDEKDREGIRRLAIQKPEDFRPQHIEELVRQAFALED